MCEQSVFLSGNCTGQGENALMSFLKAGDSTVVRGSMSSIIYSVTSFLTSTDDAPFLPSVVCLLQLLSPFSPSATGLFFFPPHTLSGKLTTRFTVL